MPSTSTRLLTRLAAAMLLVLGVVGGMAVTSSTPAGAISLPHPTSTNLDCPDTVEYGTPVGCTITVTDVAPGWMGAKKVPTGTVSVGTILNRLDVDGSPCTLVGATSSSATCSVTVTPTDTGHIAPGAAYVPSGNFILSADVEVLYADPAPLTITADDLNRPYGSDNPELTVSYAGFKLDDGPDDLDGALSCVTDATTTSPAGEYGIECDGLSSDHYEITWIDGTLTVDPAELTITVDDATRTYGDANPTFTVSYAGFVLGEGPDDLDGTLECASAPVTADAGDYDIVCEGLTSDNYDITWIDGTLTVDPAELTITAEDAARVTGQANPTFGATYAGFVNGDGPADLDGTLACSSPATPSSPVGDYDISCEGLSSDNYDITWVDGTLDVLAAPTGETGGGDVTPGGDIDIDSGGWKPGTDVTVTVCGVKVGTLTADADGRVKGSLPLPADLPTGQCEVVLSGTDAAGGPYALVLGITVEAAPAPAPQPVTPAGVLPYTGGPIGTTVLAGLGVLLLGGALVLLRRRATA